MYLIFIKHDQRLQNCQARIVKNFHTTVIGVMIDLSPEKALALVPVKLSREIVVGVPGLSLALKASKQGLNLSANIYV